MKSTKSAIRYAKALLELSIENSNLEDVSSDMKRIVESSKETNDFKVFLNSPVIKTDKKIEIMKVLFVGFENRWIGENLIVEARDTCYESLLWPHTCHQQISF